MKNLLFVLSFFFTFTATAQVDDQWRMIGSVDNSGWAVVDDSTYTGNINFQSDLTGKGFLATNIQTGYRVFTQTSQMYRVDVVTSTTFSSAQVRIVEYGANRGTPVGQLMAFDPQERMTVPQIPSGSTGSTAAMQAAVDTWNSRLDEAYIVSQLSELSGLNCNTGNWAYVSNDNVWYYCDGTQWVEFSGGGQKFENVIYVAKNVANDGNGSFTKPYSNLWIAKDSAKSGDLIHVLNGTHVIDTVGSGADKTGSTLDLEDISLIKDGVNYYLAPNVRIENNMRDSTVHLFYDTLGQTTSVYGHGTLAVGYNTTSAGFAFLNDSLSNVNIQCDSILWSDKADPIGWIRSGNLVNYQTAYFDVKYYEPKNSNFIMVNNDLPEDTTRNAKFRFNVDVLNANGAFYTFNLTRTSPIENCDVQVNIGYAYGDLPQYIFYISGGGGNNNQITIDIDKANFASSPFGMLTMSTRFTAGNNNTFHFNCDDCYSTQKLIRFEDFNSGGNNNTVAITGNYRSRDQAVIRLRYPTEATLSEGLTLTLDGTFVSDSSVVISNETRSLQLAMRGRYETLTDNPILQITRTNFVGSVDIDAATLIQPSTATTNPIESNTVGTVVSTFNSSANSNRQSANVTYQYNKELGLDAQAVPYENATTPDSNNVAAGLNDLYNRASIADLPQGNVTIDAQGNKLEFDNMGITRINSDTSGTQTAGYEENWSTASSIESYLRSYSKSDPVNSLQEIRFNIGLSKMQFTDPEAGIVDLDRLTGRYSFPAKITASTTETVAHDAEYTIDASGAGVPFTVTLDVANLVEGDNFEVYIKGADLQAVTLDLATGDILYEGDTAAATKAFSGTYHSLFCRFDGTNIRIDER